MSTADNNRLILGWQTVGKDTGPDHLRLVPHRRTGPTALPENHKPIHAPETGHIATFAPANADINTASIIPNLMQYEGSAIIIDSSAGIYSQTHQHRRDMGQEVYLIDPFNITSDKSESLNILAPFTGKPVEDIESYIELASIFNIRDSAPDLRIQQAIHIIAAAFYRQARAAKPEQRTLMAAHDFLNQSIEDIMEDMTCHEAKDDHRASEAAIFQIIQQANCQVAHELALSWLSFCRYSSLAQASSTTSFPVEALSENHPLTLYILIPWNRMKLYAPLIRLWLRYIAQQMEKRSRKPAANTIMFLTDTARYATAESIIELSEIPPPHGVQLWSFWHNLKQLEQVQYDFSEYLTHNISCLQTYGQMSCKASYDMKMSFTNGLIQGIMTIPDGQQGLQIHDGSFFTCYRLDRNPQDILPTIREGGK